jgi:hypothetical protein
MKTIETKDGFKLKITKVYGKTERFYGKVSVLVGDSRTSSRFDIHYFNSIVFDKDKI